MDNVVGIWINFGGMGINGVGTDVDLILDMLQLDSMIPVTRLE